MIGDYLKLQEAKRLLDKEQKKEEQNKRAERLDKGQNNL